MTNQVTPVESRDYIAARDIWAASTAQDGGTFTLDGEPAKTGIAVTIAVLAKVEELTIFKIMDAIEQVNRVYEGPAPQHLGTWYDAENGVWEISQTALFETREAAMLLASLLEERYVYDIDADECVAVA